MSLIGIDIGSSSVKTAAYFEPDAKRAALHQARQEAYRSLVPNLIAIVYARWH
jgi:hypothetical protein